MLKDTLRLKLAAPPPRTDYAKRIPLKYSKVLTCLQRLSTALERVLGQLCTTLRAGKLCWIRVTSC
jgi:hypothetical protein